MEAQDNSVSYNKSRLFLIGAMALFTAALSAAIRAAVAGDIKAEYIDPVSLATSGELIAQALAISFLGFSCVLFGLSPFLDIIGMKRMLIGAAICFVVGNLVIIFAGELGTSEHIYWYIWAGMLINGLGWGAVEATINPMVASLYKDDMTHRLNVLHAWWPAGLMLGGLLGVAFSAIDVNWKMALVPIMVSAAVFAFLCMGVQFPQSERVDRGVSFGDMFKEIIRRPSFFIWFAAMFLTAASELAPGQWVDVALSHTVGMRGILLLVYVAGLMFVMRHFAGPISHLLSDTGLLWFSSLLTALGLYFLSIANTPVTGLLAATVWGVGVAFMWPTMLAAVAQRYPNGGAFVIGLIGGAGSLSVYLVLPRLGQLYDQAKITAAGGVEQLQTLNAEETVKVDTIAATESFQAIALLPIILLFIFGVLWFFEIRNRKLHLRNKLLAARV
ncbi:MAG: MFS family permease [Gammaproteobacteria bacterium]|jgi:MFS family permease